MTEIRAELHRWAVLLSVSLAIVGSALRRGRNARRRRRAWRKVESWWV